MSTILLYAMVFLHIVCDYYLQGILAQMKQKSWREKNAPDPRELLRRRNQMMEESCSWNTDYKRWATSGNNQCMKTYIRLKKKGGKNED